MSNSKPHKKELDICILGETGRTIQIEGNEEIGYVFITTEEDMTMESVWLSDEDFKRVFWTLKQCELV